MKEYESKEELKEEITKAYKKYIEEFTDIDEKLKDQKFDGVDRSPAENLSYQVGWTSLLIKWEEDEKKGLEVKHHRINLNGMNLENYMNSLMKLIPICP